MLRGEYYTKDFEEYIENAMRYLDDLEEHVSKHREDLEQDFEFLRWIPKIQKLSPDKLLQEILKFADLYVKNGIDEEYVPTLREQNPEMSNDELAQKIVRMKSLQCGVFGVITGALGVGTLFTTIRGNAKRWKVQIDMVMAIAEVYGYTAELIDVMLIVTGGLAKEELKRAGIEIGEEVTRKAVEKRVTRATMKTIFPKLAPLIGSVISFIIDRPAVRLVGNVAIKYYSGRG